MQIFLTMICQQFAYAHIHQGYDCGYSCFYYHISLEHLCPVTTCSCSKDRLYVLLFWLATGTHSITQWMFFFFFSCPSILRQQQLLWPTYWLVNRHTQFFFSRTHTWAHKHTHGRTHVPTYFMHTCLWIQAFIRTHYNALNDAWTLVFVTIHQSPLRHISSKPVE